MMEDVSLESYNTYRIKSKTKYLVLPSSMEELLSNLDWARVNKWKYLVLGNGSNVILPDEEFQGLIICLKNYKSVEINEATGEIKAGSGILLPVLGKIAIENNLKGLEWAIGIPGTLGGAVYNNAGAYLDEIMHYVKEVTILEDEKIKAIKKEDINFGYRTTSFKQNKKKVIILDVTLTLSKGNKEESLKMVEDRRLRRLASQPLEYPSAGSVFRNPSPDMPAGKLIEECGLKGYHINDAYVSEKHANFIVNKGHATSKDIRKLIEIIKEEVEKKYNIKLILEQEIIDWM